MNRVRPRTHSRLGRVARAAVVTPIAALACLTAAPAIAQPLPLPLVPLYLETFRFAQNVPILWSTAKKGTFQPCLTGQPSGIVPPIPTSLPACTTPSDPIGQGAFRLTDNSKDQSGSLVFNKPLITLKGLRFEFDLFQYKTAALRAGKGADGISFYLVDGAQPTVTPGDAGGSLGYKGLAGAIVGIGFDEYGNFSHPNSGPGGPGLMPNNVAVRAGSATSWKYVQGAPAPQPLAVPSATTRDAAKRHVIVTISPLSVLNISMDFNDGKGIQPLVTNFNLKAIPGQPTLPPSLKLGFTAATGQGTAIHEIRDFKIGKLL